MNSKVSLYFTDGSSDKEYHVELVAAPDDVGFLVKFAYGRRGGTLNTGAKTTAPVELAKAQKIFDKLVAEKKAKGYTQEEGGVAYAGTEIAGTVSGVLPQLLNVVPDADLERMLSDANWIAQEKVDGRRCMLICKDGELRATNRKGLFVSFPESWRRVSLAHDFVIDGEAIGEVFHAFELLEYDGQNLRSKNVLERIGALNAMDDRGELDVSIQIVATALHPDAKRVLFKMIEQRDGEGIVFKKLNAAYTSGRPNSGGCALKYKFLESASCLVIQTNDGKRSALLALFDDEGKRHYVGSVTIPPNHPVPADGAVVEVRYLYKFVAGSLFQPVYLGERKDVDSSACLLSQVKRLKMPLGQLGLPNGEAVSSVVSQQSTPADALAA